MCGVAGIFAYHYAALEVDRDELRLTRDSMIRRGPDGAGEWYSEDGRVGLAHRRLAIIDLSAGASQPMVSQDGALVVSFNGEIYNYKELRQKLIARGRVFRTNSDTEVLLHLYAEKGGAMVEDLRGMFAFVLWDAKKQTMLLARDPYGIKPLYYADDGWTVRIASQVKALLQSPKVSRIPEPAGSVGFYLFGSVPEPYTTYQEIRQVPAGSIVEINGLGPSAPKPYFSIARIFERGCNGGVTPPLRSVHDALLDSVRHHFVSDVPVGIFLSSGIDSSALVALAREAGIGDLRTITLAFEQFKGTDQDEAPLAGEVARHYGTRHTTRVVSQEEFQNDLPKILEAMDQPTIDGVNTYFVAKVAAEQGLKVALSGLGGDELFGGYPSFRQIPMLVQAMAIPSRIPFLGDAVRYLISPFISGGGAQPCAPTISPKYAGLVKYGGTYAGAYFLRRGLFMPWELESVLDRETAVEGLRRLRPLGHIESQLHPDPKTPFARVAVLEASIYLRNQLLRDSDWAGMAHSVEIRVPYVDGALLGKVASQVVSSHSVSSRMGNKRFLIGSLKNPLPHGIASRKKRGFVVPLSSRQWAHAVYAKN